MLDEFEEVSWSAEEAHLRSGADESSSAARELTGRAMRAFANANAEFRARILERMLLTLGPLALVGVAEGAFAGLIERYRPGRFGLRPEEAWQYTTEQFAALSDFVVQVNPEVLMSLVVGPI